MESFFSKWGIEQPIPTERSRSPIGLFEGPAKKKGSTPKKVKETEWDFPYNPLEVWEWPRQGTSPSPSPKRGSPQRVGLFGMDEADTKPRRSPKRGSPQRVGLFGIDEADRRSPKRGSPQRVGLFGMDEKYTPMNF